MYLKITEFINSLIFKIKCCFIKRKYHIIIRTDQNLILYFNCMKHLFDNGERIVDALHSKHDSGEYADSLVRSFRDREQKLTRDFKYVAKEKDVDLLTPIKEEKYKKHAYGLARHCNCDDVADAFASNDTVRKCVCCSYNIIERRTMANLALQHLDAINVDWMERIASLLQYKEIEDSVKAFQISAKSLLELKERIKDVFLADQETIKKKKEKLNPDSDKLIDGVIKSIKKH